jgi:hypothetical protein
MNFKELEKELNERVAKKYAGYFANRLHTINTKANNEESYEEEYKQTIEDFISLEDKYKKHVFGSLEKEIKFIEYYHRPDEVSQEYYFIIDLMKDKRFDFKDFYEPAEKHPDAEKNEYKETIETIALLKQAQNRGSIDNSDLSYNYLHRFNNENKNLFYEVFVHRQGDFNKELLEEIFKNNNIGNLKLGLGDKQTLLNEYSYGDFEIEKTIFKLQSSHILYELSYPIRRRETQSDKRIIEISDEKLYEIYDTHLKNNNDFKSMYSNPIPKHLRPDYSSGISLFNHTIARTLSFFDLSFNDEHLNNFYEAYDQFFEENRGSKFNIDNLKPLAFMPHLYLKEYSKDLNNYKAIFSDNSLHIVDYYNFHVSNRTLNFIECIDSIRAIKEYNSHYSIPMKIDRLITEATEQFIEFYDKFHHYKEEEFQCLMELCEINGTDKITILNTLKEKMPEIEQNEHFEKNVLQTQLSYF